MRWYVLAAMGMASAIVLLRRRGNEGPRQGIWAMNYECINLRRTSNWTASRRTPIRVGRLDKIFEQWDASSAPRRTILANLLQLLEQVDGTASQAI